MPYLEVRQLADIALRALSPAVNDPTTAILCIKYLEAVLEHFVRYQPQPNVFHLAKGASILEVRQPTLREYLEVFLEIAHYSEETRVSTRRFSQPCKRSWSLPNNLTTKSIKPLL